MSTVELEMSAVEDDDMVKYGDQMKDASALNDVLSAVETKIGASEKVLSRAAHLTDDSMHRFK